MNLPHLEKLNKQQKEAVLYNQGPMMVLAGAGSGKTRTIIAKIVHLIKVENILPWRILAVTFTNRAANEMKERILRELPNTPPQQLNLSTFHSFCVRVLRMNSEALGLKSSFTIYDDSETKTLANQILKLNHIDPKKTPPSALTHFVDMVKNEGFYVGRQNFNLKKQLLDNELYPLFLQYERELVKNNAVDFGSLITRTIELLEKNPEVLKTYSEKYDYILVDEYQDTNKAQFELIRLLSQTKQKLCVVGDSDQCLPEGTLVKIGANKYVPIEQVKVGDKVLSAKGSDKVLPTSVIRVYKRAYEKGLIKITLSSGREVLSTPEHIHFAQVEKEQSKFTDFTLTLLGGNSSQQSLFTTHTYEVNGETIHNTDLSEIYRLYESLSKQRRLNLVEQILVHKHTLNFMRADQILVGMKMLNEDLELETVTAYEAVEYRGYVYDLDVDRSHNFIANGIFTHNSIYSWRGAEIKNILDFEKQFKNAKIYLLEENYRSSKNIIDAATAVIKRNVFRKDKTMFTNNGAGEKVKVYQCLDSNREAHFVAQSINDLIKKKVSPKEIAIFYRTNAQSRNLEDSLRSYLIPYQVIGGLKFYERREIKDMVAYLQVIGNPQDDVSLLRIINSPTRGLGEKSIDALVEKARNAGLYLFQYLQQALANNPKALGGAKAQAGVREFVEIIELGQRLVAESYSLDDIYDQILERTRYIEILQASKKIEDEARIENLQELKTSILQFMTNAEEKTLASYLETITLDRTEDQNPDGKISLMTVHSSKGLEFDYVFLVGVEENIFPSPQSENEGIERLEEERRLFYVAITRARKECAIFHANMRMLYGKTNYNPPSRFLLEIPRDFLARFRV